MKKDRSYMLEYENKYKENYKLIAGVDEVGRGPLAGPVMCASVIMDLNNIIDGVDDSKKLSAKKRDLLYDKIIENCISYNVSFKDNTCIDEINILEATKLCMTEAVQGLNVKPDIVFVDALTLKNLDIQQLSIVHGDALSYSIACASIVAKVTRDRLMDKLHDKYPEYNFIKNKGYGTKEHIEAIKKYGITDIHRKTFTKNFISN